MVQYLKLLERMRRNPQDDWKIADLESLCHAFDMKCEPPTHGSHYKISHSLIAEILTVPYKRPIKVVYIRKFIALIDEVRRIGP